MSSPWSRHSLLAIAAVMAIAVSGCSEKTESAKSSDDKTTKTTVDDKTTTPDDKTGQPSDADKTVAQTGTNTPKPKTDVPAGPKNGLDVSYLLPEFEIGVIAHPGRVLGDFAKKFPPLAEKLAEGKELAGFDPADIEQVLVLVSPLDENFAFVARFSKPLNADEVIPKMMDDGHEVVEHDGMSYYKNANERDPSVYMPDDKTVVAARSADLERMMAKPSPDNELTAMLTTADLNNELVVCVVADRLAAEAKKNMAQVELPFPFSSLKELPDLISAGSLELELTEAVGLVLKVKSPDQKSSERVSQLLDPLINMGKGIAQQQLTNMPPQVADMARPVLESLKVEQAGDQFSVSLKIDQPGILDAVAGMALPAIMAAQGAAQITNDKNSLKQIGLAMHNYHDVYGHLPVASEGIKTDKDGKPLLSWRVHILPFIEERELYEQFNLDEPWDSENNKDLIEFIPQVYVMKGGPDDGKTMVQAPIGEGSIFGGDKEVGFRNITDGTSNTIMVVVTKPEKAVPWTKPADLAFDAKDPAADLQATPAGYLALFGDGAVLTIKASLKAATWALLFNREDGMVLPEQLRE